MGFLIYMTLFYVILLVLSKANLVIFKFSIKSPLQVLGVLLITIAFFIIINWESPYVNLVTGRIVENTSQILYQSEDGATWYLWSKFTQNNQILRLLTFVITPFLLTIAGSLFIEKKIRFGR